jgi:hypothetical protein
MATTQIDRDLSDRAGKPNLIHRGPGSVGPAIADVPRNYGAKVKGLLLIPMHWAPPFAAIPTWVYEEYAASRPIEECFEELEPTLSRVLDLLSDEGRGPVIVRSSAVFETLETRGKFRSCLLGQGATLSTVANALKEIFDQFHLSRHEGSIGVVLQTYAEPTYLGHLSNEVHLSPTRNQWIYEMTEHQYEDRMGLNSLGAKLPDSAKPLFVRKPREVHQILRSVGVWATQTFPNRAHFEWCISDNSFWLLQLDLENRVSEGADPTLEPGSTEMQVLNRRVPPSCLPSTM